MTTTLIIGAGGVGRVVAHKCFLNKEVFGRIILASRTLSKCQIIANELNQNVSGFNHYGCMHSYKDTLP